MSGYKNIVYGAVIMLVVYAVLLIVGMSFKTVFIATSIATSIKIVALEVTIREMEMRSKDESRTYRTKGS